MTGNTKERIVILGGPRTGKTTLSQKFTPPVHHCDDLIGSCDWSAQSEEISTWFDRPGPWVIEGVAAVRALRKWLAAHADGKPCDRVIEMWRPCVPLNHGQHRMMAGCMTVWQGIAADVAGRGVSLERIA